jgi:hypothetical protein
MMSEKTEKMTKKELRSFGLITGAIVLVLFGVAPWLISGKLHKWPFIIAAVLWMPALIFPMVLEPVYHGWMKFGHVMGWINTRIILSIMFYLIIAPIGLIMKILGKDPMRRKLDSSVESYRIESDKKDKSHVERVF